MLKLNKKEKRNPRKKKEKMKGGGQNNNNNGNKDGKDTDEIETSVSVSPTTNIIVSSSLSSFIASDTKVSTTIAGFSSPSSGKINSGTIAAIVIASLAFVILIVILIRLFMKKQKQGQAETSTYEMYSEVDHSTALGDSIRVNMPANSGMMRNVNPEHIDQDNVYHELDQTRMEPIQITQPTYDHIISSVNIRPSQKPNASSGIENGTSSMHIHRREGLQSEQGTKSLTNAGKLINDQEQQQQASKIASGQQQKKITRVNSDTSSKSEPKQSVVELPETDPSNEYFMLEPNPDPENCDTPENSEYFVLEPENTEMIKDKTNEI